MKLNHSAYLKLSLAHSPYFISSPA